MKKLLFFLLLATSGTAQTVLPRVTLEAPLTPVSGPSYVAAPGAISLTAAPQFLSVPPALTAAPALTVAPAAASLSLAPALAAPAPTALAAEQLVPAAAAPAFSAAAGFAPARAAAGAASAAGGPRVVDSLRANAPLAAEITAAAETGSAENSARALESNFNAAASLGDGGSGNGAVLPPSGEGAAPGEPAPLLARLLARVRLDEGNSPEQRAALTHAFARMLETPTAQAHAERFLTDGVPASVRFVTFPESRIEIENGRKIFRAKRAETEWKDDHVEITVNRDYLGIDSEFLEQDLPPTLAHELFGHGYWYFHAARVNALQALHHHELNETNARLIGWLVDFELDHRLEESGAWDYLANPAAFMAYLKLRLPYYALTWSTEELAHPLETLESRSAAAKARRAVAVAELANNKTWNPVVDFFVSRGEVPESRVRALRGYLAAFARGREDDIRMLDALLSDVDGTIARMNAEPDRSSEAYLKWAGAHPLFPLLKAEADEGTRRLTEMVGLAHAKESDVSPEAAAASAEHWRDQLTFPELVEMYRKDREKNPSHWR